MRIPKNVEQLLFGLGIAASAIAGIAIVMIVGSFLPTFENAGIQMPNLTRLVVTSRWLFLALPLVVVAAWYAWPIRATRAIAALALGVGSFVVLVPLTLFAMYYPIFVLGHMI